MKIELIEDKHLDMLQEFCNTCATLGYNNNSSIEAMRLEWCQKTGKYFCAVNDNKIIAVAGCHPFIQLNRFYKNPWRILFRGCELPNHDTFKGLSKSDWNSITQREMIPKFIEVCNSDELFISTNISNDNSNGKALRNHRLMGLLAKQGILTHIDDITVYDVYQSIWQLNIKIYNKKRALIRNNYVD
jgi:hypothetical protein